MKSQDNTVEALAIICLTLIAVVTAYSLKAEAATVISGIAGGIVGYLTRSLSSALKETRKASTPPPIVMNAERDRGPLLHNDQGEIVVAIAIALGVWMVGGIIFHAAKAKGVF